jgi:diaminopimelate decarboxylase
MFEVKDYLENHKGKLFIGGCSAEKLAAEFGTPLYVYDEGRIKDNYFRLFNAFKKHYKDFELYYPVKCNNNLAEPGN